jgi:uncharacterized protein (TIGR02001 family)
MTNVRKLIAGGLLAATGVANADVTATVTAASQYDFRGITQSAKDPAIQASVDYAHASGLYAGIWGSNVDFAPGSKPSLEVDFYGGYKKSLESGVGFDVGGVYYTYFDNPTPGVNYVELYAGASYQWVSTKLFFSPDYGGKSTAGNTEAWYISGDASIPLPKDFTLLAHVGYSFGDYWKNLAKEYVDYSVGVGYTLGKFNLALKWVDGSDAIDTAGSDYFSSDSKVLFTIATTFPW